MGKANGENQQTTQQIHTKVIILKIGSLDKECTHGPQVIDMRGVI